MAPRAEDRVPASHPDRISLGPEFHPLPYQHWEESTKEVQRSWSPGTSSAAKTSSSRPNHEYRYVETLWRHSSSELVTTYLLSFQCHQWWWELLCKQRRRRKNRGGQLLTFSVLCEIIPRGKKIIIWLRKKTFICECFKNRCFIHCRFARVLFTFWFDEKNFVYFL